MTTSTAVRRRPRERIGADEARRWARQLDLGNPYAKAIMLAAANYMNEEGTAYPGTATLARDTDISEDTVVKRLRWLADIGAIALFRCWRDERGQRNYDGRGKPTSSEIRFLFDTEPDEIRARARGETRSDDACETSGVSPRPERGLNEEAQPPASPRLAPCQPPKSEGQKPSDHITARARLELEQESQPQTPSQSEGAFERHEVESDEAEVWLREFGTRYPIPISDWSKALTIARGLTEAERTEALTGAEGYAALCRSQAKRGIEDAHRWLKNRKWQGYLAAGHKAQERARMVTVPDDSPQGLIWKAIYDIATRGQGVPYFCLSGPANARVATVPYAQPDAMIAIATDRAEWIDVAEDDGTQRFHAWLRWLRAILPNQRISFGPLGGARRLRVPCDWPPRKDGTISGRDPPDQSAA